MKPMLWFQSLLTVLLLAAPALGQTETEEARKLFVVSCAPCHGANGQGARSQAEGVKPPDLTQGVFKAGTRDEDLYRVIAKGVSESGMPSFEQLGPEKIRELVAYVRSLSRGGAPVAGDPAKGE